MLPDATAQRLSEYVQNGGVLFADSRTGVKDETGLCHARTLPGLLADALGIVVEEYESLDHTWRGGSFEYAAAGKGAFEGTYTATQTAEWVQPTSAEALVGYTDWHMQEFAALTRNRFGQGWGYFLGTAIKEEPFYDVLVAEMLEKAGVETCNMPEGVEVSQREGNGKKLLFVLNHTEEVQTVMVPAGKVDLLTGATTGEALMLDRYGVAVIQL